MINNFTLSYATKHLGHIHTYLTYSFSHYSFWHLLSNMIPLFFFGRSIEMYFGSKLLLYLYLGGALTGGLMASKYNY